MTLRRTGSQRSSTAACRRCPRRPRQDRPMEQSDDELAEVAGRAVPGVVESITVLGRGSDHVAFEVNRDLVVRVALHGEAAARLRGEAALLTLVGRVSPIPVPEPVASDAATGALVLRRIEGRSLLDAPPARPRELVGQLAGLLAALHAMSLDDAKQVVGPDPYPLTGAL